MQEIKNILSLPRVVGPANGVKANDGFLSPANATNCWAFCLVGARDTSQTLYKYCEHLFSINHIKLAYNIADLFTSTDNKCEKKN